MEPFVLTYTSREAGGIRKAIADAWWMGRASVEDLPPELATGPALHEACDKVVAVLVQTYDLKESA